jgi:hypothetical protein
VQWQLHSLACIRFRACCAFALAGERRGSAPSAGDLTDLTAARSFSFVFGVLGAGMRCVD